MASYRELSGALEALCKAIRYGNVGPGSSMLAYCEALVADARRGLPAETSWTPFTERETGSLSDASLAAIAARVSMSMEDARAMVAAETAGVRILVNSRYQVMHRAMDDDFAYLSIKRLDQQPVRSWRDLQRIKSELIGPECEAVEVFPAESRLVDMSNQYHLFALTDPTRRIPFGFDDGRHVFAESAGATMQAPEDQ